MNGIVTIHAVVNKKNQIGMSKGQLTYYFYMSCCLAPKKNSLDMNIQMNLLHKNGYILRFSQHKDLRLKKKRKNVSFCIMNRLGREGLSLGNSKMM